MTSHQPKDRLWFAAAGLLKLQRTCQVGPRLKISVPNFKRTDFSGEIEKLGGLHSGSSRKIRSVPRSDPDPSANRLKASAGFRLDPDPPQEGYPDRAPEAGADFNAWLRSLAPPKEQTSPSGADGREFLPPKDEEDVRGPGSYFHGPGLVRGDSPMDFEVHTPEEWLALCKQGPTAGKPQAAVLHYAAQEWRMLPCWVLGYEAASSRYIVELEDGSRKQVKRLALRFNEEDAQNFALRVETCRAKKAHCELQQAFIRFIESQPDELVSSMLRDQKERFIRQGLHGSHLEDAGSFVSQIRDLIREIEENYVLSMKFAKVKNDLILEMGTPYACVRDDTPFAPLLTSFLPTEPPQFGLVAHQDKLQLDSDSTAFGLNPRSGDAMAVPVAGHRRGVATWLKENGATCKQVLRLLLGTWMALCGGSLYAFSRFEVQIMTRCSLTAQQLDVVYAAGQAGVGLGIVPGTLFDLYGPVGTSLYGAAFTAAGNLGLASMLSGDQCGGVSSLATWYFLVQQGSVAIFQAGLFTNIVEAPPKMQGIITGIVSSGYGLSAAFVTLLFAFFQEDLDAYFKGTALLFSATGLLAACTMPLLRGGSRATAYGRLEHKDEAGGRSPPPATTYGRQEQEELPEAAPVPASSSPSLSRRDILCRADFWLFLLPFVLVQSIGSGLYIANLSLIGDSLGISPDSRPVYVRTVPYCNSLGRIFSGLAMDTLEPRGIHRSDHLLLSAFAVILASVALFLLPEEVVPAMLLPALAVIAAAYGSNWAIMPSYISKRFYGSHVGVMFNIHSGHIAVAVLLTSYAVGGLYDTQAELQGEGSFCHGTTCWRPAFAMGLIVQAVALAVALLLMWKVRRPQISESKAASEKTCHEK
eukprot:s1229_g10.t2